jgi:hypothetical protein
MDRISSPVLPCASRESITFLDIIKKKSVVNCVLSEGAPSSLVVAVVLLLGACLVYTLVTGVEYIRLLHLQAANSQQHPHQQDAETVQIPSLD